METGLISGSAELREQAAQGLGELIEVTSEESLKPFVIPITGPLIRITSDRFPWQVKSAILSTFSIMIRKDGMALNLFYRSFRRHLSSVVVIIRGVKTKEAGKHT